MRSYGESQFMVGNRIAGKVRVLNVHHDRAIYPRISLTLGFTLNDLQPTEHPSTRFIDAFEIRDLAGELRLAETSLAIGPLRWVGPRQHVRSTRYGSESHIGVACDLDWVRIETIEEHRAGGEATFWLALWPTAISNDHYFDCEVRTFRATVPHAVWHSYLEQLTGLRRSLVEIVLPSISSQHFSAALTHVAESKRRADIGDFDESLASCRRAIEATFGALNLPNSAPELEAKLGPITDPKRAKAYAGIVSRLKELGNLTVHRENASGLYSRAEAQYAVAVTAHTISLLASLLGSARSDA